MTRGANISDIVDVLDQIFKDPGRVIQQELDSRWAFAVRHEPSEDSSDDGPPLQIKDEAELLTIDGMLGQYDPDTQKITIFSKGIDCVAKILSARPEHLRLVVRLHEWAHALLHIGMEEGDRLSVTKDDSLWPEYLKRAANGFRGFDTTLQERIPQLLTHHGLHSLRDAAQPKARSVLDRIIRTFEKLARRSAPEYQIDDYVSVPKERLAKSIGLLKNGTLIGVEAWETVITW